jgi:hypothetical protein
MNIFLVTMLTVLLIFAVQDLVGARPPGGMTTAAWWFNGGLVAIAGSKIVEIVWR